MITGSSSFRSLPKEASFPTALAKIQALKIIALHGSPAHLCWLARVGHRPNSIAGGWGRWRVKGEVASSELHKLTMERNYFLQSQVRLLLPEEREISAVQAVKTDILDVHKPYSIVIHPLAPCCLDCVQLHLGACSKCKSSGSTQANLQHSPRWFRLHVKAWEASARPVAANVFKEKELHGSDH